EQHFGAGRDRHARGPPHRDPGHGRGRRHFHTGAEADFQALLSHSRGGGDARQGYGVGAVHRAVGGGETWRARLCGEQRRGPWQHVYAAASVRATAVGTRMSRVLIVEDEEHLATGLRFNLEAEGYEVETVDAGEAALKLLMETPQRFDVVVLDVMLPGKDGFTVVSELRHAGRF